MSSSEGTTEKVENRPESSSSNVKCTICSKILNLFIGNDLQSHPDLEVPICKRCHKYLTDDAGTWTQDENGKDEYCRWCGEGGNIIECDFCPKGFCTSCIRRNIGRTYFQDLKSKIDTDQTFKFKCFCCDRTKIENLRRKMVDLQNLIREKTKNCRKSTKNRRFSSANKPDIQISLKDLRSKIENLKNLAIIDDLSTMDLKLKDEKCGKFSTILDFLQKSVSSFNSVLEKSRDLALKEEDDKDFRTSQQKFGSKSKKSSFYFAHQAIKHFTDGFLIASVLIEKSQNLEEKSPNLEEKSQNLEEESSNLEQIPPILEEKLQKSPISDEKSQKSPILDEKSQKSPKIDKITTKNQENHSKKIVKKIAHQLPNLDVSLEDQIIKVEITGDENILDIEEKNEKIQLDSQSTSVIMEKSIKSDAKKSDQEKEKISDESDSETSLKSVQEKSLSIFGSKSDSEISTKSVPEKSKKERKSILSKKFDSKKSINRSSDSIDKINDESIKKSESGKSIEMEKSDLNSDREIDESKLDSETSKKSVEKKSENGQFDDILSKFDQDFRSVGQLVLKVDKLKFVNDENDDDQNLNSDKEKMSKFKKKRRKNDENSTKNDDENEEITILDEKSNSESESGSEDENILMDFSNLEKQDNNNISIPAIVVESDQDNSSTESESENQSKLTKIQKRRENKIEDQQIEEEEELTTNQLKADEQLKKLLKLRVNMNANELILQENDENYIENDGKLTKKNAVKVLSSGEEEEEKEDQIDDDENSQNSNFEDEILKEENSSDDDLDFKSPKKKFNSTKNKNKKRKNLVESNSELDENGENDDSDSDSGSKKKKKNSKVKPKSRGRKRRIAVSTEEEDDDDEENDDLDADSSNKKGRKEIRKIKKASSLQTDAYEEERERRKRIAEKQNMYNKIDHELIDIDTMMNQAAGDSSKIGDNLLILDQNLENKEEIFVQVHPKISRFLKPHQLEGVRFLYNCTIESVEKAKEPGSGSILAHCMGLGKTFQVVAFLHTILTNERLNLKTAIVLAPVNVVLNWQHEFKHWLNDLDDELDLNVWELATVKSVEDRSKTIATWQDQGGILILGYTLFVQLADDSKKDKRIKDKYRKIFKAGLLDPGPDFIVCDEGHMLKNEKTALSRVLSKIRTKRRICLTGTPLQNNLKEYYTMIQFVKPNLLGSKQEFANRFENPIKNGQYSNSTPHDVRIMKRRAHILHEMLAGCVQRQDYTALSKALPPKNEYVLSISLSEDQIKLYNKYLMDVVQNLDAESLKARRSLFQDFMNLQRVWTHPYALLLHTEKMERLERIKEENDFLDEGSSASASEESIFSVHDDEDDDQPPKLKKTKKDDDGAPFENEVIKTWQTRSRSGAKLQDLEENLPVLIDSAPQWYGDMVSENCKTKVELSGKCFLLFEILKKCESIGDKLLVFSQSLVALDIIENFLQFFQENGWTASKTSSNAGDDDSLAALYKWRWARDKDYFRLDGSTPPEKRKAMSKIFNDPKNLRARLFLISTKAGSLGMNLFGANRVVVFDTNWNPTHDTQSIFRVYRFGQTKPVYIYRFIAHGTMEATIYERGVTKQSLACRVIDEQQIDRHFLGSDLEALYEFKPHEKRNEKLNSVAVPKDRLLADLLFEHKKWIITYHEHDSLLQNMEEEKLSKEEMQAAWDEYESERKNLNRYTANNANYANLVANMDQFSIFCNAMPLLRVLIDEGETLVRMSREPVQYTLESIVRSWIEKDPEVKRNPPTILVKLEQLVSKLRIMVNSKLGRP